MKRALERCADTLEALGFTALEAAVYATLVERSPVTAYQVAKVLQKPTANVYKAIESLERKGAVLIDDGDARLCRASPPDELFRALDASFESRRRNAERAFAQLKTAEDDDRVYQVHSPGQVYERARTMLGRAKRVALLDLFPIPASELRADIVAAARKVSVHVKVYASVAFPGAEVTMAADRERLRARWPGHWLNVVVDGEEHLLALLSEDGRRVHQAIWSSSAYLSVLHHSGMASEICLERLAHSLAAAEPVETILRHHQADRAHLFSPELPGFHTLLARLMEAAEEGASSEAGSSDATQG